MGSGASPITSTCGTAVASSFSAARACVSAARAATTFASAAASSCRELRLELRGLRRGGRVVVQERDFERSEVALEHAQLVDGAAERRLLAEPRAEREPKNGSNTSPELHGRMLRVR